MTGLFLLNNYMQALNILAGEAALVQAMQDLHIADRCVFESWLSEEQEYLKGLIAEPIVETLEMEYYQALVKLSVVEYVDLFMSLSRLLTLSREKVDAIRQIWINTTPEVMSQNQRDTTQVRETERRHALEDRDKILVTVQDLEKKLGIKDRWRPGSVKWSTAADLVGKRTYQRCLDNLEGLIVARMFELTKMNQSQTGESLESVGHFSYSVSRLQDAQTHCEGPACTIPCYPHRY